MSIGWSRGHPIGIQRYPWNLHVSQSDVIEVTTVQFHFSQLTLKLKTVISFGSARLNLKLNEAEICVSASGQLEFSQLILKLIS